MAAGQPEASRAAPAVAGPRPPVAARATLIRLVVAPLVLALLVGLAWIQVATGDTLATDLLLGLLGAAGGLELARMLGVDRAGCVVAALSCLLLCAVGLLAPEPGAARLMARLLVLMGALLALLARSAGDVAPAAVDRIARSLLPTLYVGLLFTWMRELADGSAGGRQLIYVTLVSKASDIGGWLVGKPFGRHKLVPRISPGKSWEGLAGGVAASVLVGVLLAGPLAAPQAAWGVVPRAAFALLLALASVAAGITQSGWKRRLQVKDSSPLLPEMGGVLDMIDSLLLAGPLAVLWLALAA